MSNPGSNAESLFFAVSFFIDYLRVTDVVLIIKMASVNFYFELSYSLDGPHIGLYPLV